MSWQAFDADNMEFMRLANGQLESRLFSYTFTCHRHGVHVSVGQGECFICRACGRDKPIGGSFSVIAFRSRDPARIRDAIKRAKEVPIPQTAPGDWRLDVDLDQQDTE